MCRWLAYRGDPVRLDEILLQPEHSLLLQSRHARESTFEVNADGFGIGWYTDRPEPGVYHDTRPAWNDRNLASLAGHISSPLILAHIRAAVGSMVVRSNCHPFRHGRWLFQHNGSVGEFGRIKKELDMQIAPELYAEKQGQTDTETLFLLALTFGLQNDPKAGVTQMIEAVERAREKAGIESRFTMTIATTDGESLFAARHASYGPQPSLYHNRPGAPLESAPGKKIPLPPGAHLVLSEPLDDLSEHWVEIPPSSWLAIDEGRLTSSSL